MAKKPQPTVKKLTTIVKKHAKSFIVLGVLLLIVLVSVINQVAYKDKFLQDTILGSSNVGGLKLSEAQDLINNDIRSRQVTISHGDQNITKRADELGFIVKESELALLLNRQNKLMPRLWFISQKDQIPLQTDLAKVETELAVFSDPSYKKAVDAKLIFQDDKISVSEAAPGYGINNQKIITDISGGLQETPKEIKLEATAGELVPLITNKDAESALADAELIFGKKYKVSMIDGIREANKAELVGLFELKANNSQISIDFSKDLTAKLVADWARQSESLPVSQIKETYKSGKQERITRAGVNGKTVSNTDSVAQALHSSLVDRKDFEGTFEYKEQQFEQQTIVVDDVTKTRVVTYDVAVWGSVRSDFNQFQSQVAETLADARGWAAAGITFKQVASGGSFTIVLSEPSRVAAASSGCDSYYSCRVGRNVIINDDRWQSATSVWTGSIRDYRHMVVNHESGHWLGLNHYNCQGAGTPAPVMQQQSINLQGCVFNPWPLAFELNSVRS